MIPIILLYVGIFYLFVQPTTVQTGFMKKEILSPYAPAWMIAYLITAIILLKLAGAIQVDK